MFSFSKNRNVNEDPPQKIHLQSNDYYLKFNDIIMVNVIPNVFWMFFAGAYTYGSNCDAPCPSNCKDNICHNDHGTCYGCKPGWTGLSCTMSMICFIKNIHFILFKILTVRDTCVTLSIAVIYLLHDIACTSNYM